ncbi:MAG: CDP-2,3-bis-(O-geranylgeranyl)-sn-glycerol synthase [Candidatus Thermoplasmatota archaeon]|nr:CDP-2,3-bis-(O-geranylgeranyl)-sn-glycerol synthase [Candidatus Thermoplasmatota archaeon]
MTILVLVFAGFWFFIPAYVANPSAVLFGGGKPVDGGRTWKDGKRLLGDGKTWRGTVGGAMCGAIFGLIAWLLAELVGYGPISYGSFLQATLACFLLGSGSMFGDMLGSFIKRRVGRERGAKAPILDQYDFLIGAVLFSLVGNPEWFLDRYVLGEGWISLLTLLIITPILHRAVNILGYKMGKKDVPW